MSTDNATPSSKQPIDIFAGPHKAIRRGLADVLTRLGAAEYGDAGALGQLGRDVESLLAYCERHLQHEERVVRPACGERVSLGVFDTGHPRHLELIAECRALMRGLQAAEPQHRTTLGHALYLHFSVFVADCLHHMAEEEQVLSPLLQRALTGEELLAIQGRVMASMSQTEVVESARRMLSAVSPSEQRALTRTILERAPRAMAIALLEAARPDLSSSSFTDLMGMVQDAPVAP